MCCLFKKAINHQNWLTSHQKLLNKLVLECWQQGETLADGLWRHMPIWGPHHWGTLRTAPCHCPLASMPSRPMEVNPHSPQISKLHPLKSISVGPLGDLESVSSLQGGPFGVSSPQNSSSQLTKHELLNWLSSTGTHESTTLIPMTLQCKNVMLACVMFIYHCIHLHLLIKKCYMLGFWMGKITSLQRLIYFWEKLNAFLMTKGNHNSSQQELMHMFMFDPIVHDMCMGKFQSCLKNRCR